MRRSPQGAQAVAAQRVELIPSGDTVLTRDAICTERIYRGEQWMCAFLWYGTDRV